MKQHAQASEVIVQVLMEANTIGIYVEDNGQGYSKSVNIKDGLGLKSIRYLTELLNGKFEVSAGQDHGFVVSVDFERN